MTSLRRNLRYVSWLVSDTSKGLAQTLFSFAIPLLALIVTDDPALAGIIGAVGLTIRVVLTLFGGVLADRHRRITLMVLGSAIGVVLSVGFTLLALGDALTFGILLVADALLAARTGLFDSAGESALKDIVTSDTMGRAQAANSARDSVLQLAGGPIGGALLVVGGWLVGAVMALCHLVAAVSAALIPRLRGPEIEAVPQAAVAAPSPRPNALREIREGFSWLFSRPDLRGVLLILTIINLGINTVMTTIVYSLQQSGESPAVIGLISAGLGGSMLVGALLASVVVTRVGAGLLMMIGLVALTVGAAATTLVQAPLWIVAVMAIPGLTLGPLNAAMGGYFMVATPSGMMGRASSASNVFAMGAMPLAPLIAGFGLNWFGRSGSILIGAGLCALAAVMALSNRGLRSLPAEADWAAHAARFADAEADAVANTDAEAPVR
ncbi:MFS transporter [Microbacterium sp. NPDC057650]|uniref:MFS transporter n=1 Tax=unclassified Microbacterium TaxID=2609290 RepID=UPI00366E4FD3